MLRESARSPETFLNCYEITNPDALRWGARLYKVRRANRDASHAQRGQAKDILYKLRYKHRDLCPGYGFIVDFDPETVAVPVAWNLPSEMREAEFVVTFDRFVTTDPKDRAHRLLIAGILRDAIKQVFKKNDTDHLGELWQNFDRFCQTPHWRDSRRFHFCRNFVAIPKVLRGNRWVLQVNISTTTLDGWTFADYFGRGAVRELKDMIAAKQNNKFDRQNQKTAVRVLRVRTNDDMAKGVVLDLDEPNLLDSLAALSRSEQIRRANGKIKCRQFSAKTLLDVPFEELRLVLDSQITHADHSQTILEPAERLHWMSLVREFLADLDFVETTIELATTPIDVESFDNRIIPLPTLRVRGPGSSERQVRSAHPATEQTIRHRGRQRQDALRKYGYLQGQPINPLLALPKHLGVPRAARMMDDMNRIMANTGIDFRFKFWLYESVDELSRHIVANGYDALLVVLPEGSHQAHSDDDTHEKIKKHIEVPSQCVQHDHILPEVWLECDPGEIERQDRLLSRRIKGCYELCLWSLLAKLGWIPFAPLDPFAYNVHLGLDVGGRANNKIMACLGYGFVNPNQGLLFRPEEVPIDLNKAEPIPTSYLVTGLLRIFEQIRHDLGDLDIAFDLERVLFFRDGRLLGQGDDWNEVDALRQVYRRLRERGWVSSEAVWTAVEVMKGAEELRVMTYNGTAGNPLVGQCIFPFDDDAVALICTTGIPYLTQGTAKPLKLKIIDIHGRSNSQEVIRDLLWESDMCFTKPDMGTSLPWTLHVADEGALQMSRSYKISGITI